ncbi:hypothetical protein NA57DRAFT_45255 [Rhizodiscina lignyota]|uniref:B30.2/SPRY domain-containing protein n=1 Tax=Rhizodiscina lignyota TaxID=1504668 RepID=A0A9P4M336_9PEZI|nr:hypothetical protein NA57DRAFT_45255 [Rhizodiscina lignyota]
MVFAHASRVVCIGLSEGGADLAQLPGWRDDSVAYHGDDGRLYSNDNQGDDYGPCFATGDTIGCGRYGELGYFTKNGQHLGSSSTIF